jgi:hypothetical protein
VSFVGRPGGRLVTAPGFFAFTSTAIFAIFFAGWLAPFARFARGVMPSRSARPGYSRGTRQRARAADARPDALVVALEDAC